MPLRALYTLYNRKIEEGDAAMPTPGYSSAPVSFALRLSGNGRLLGLSDLRVKNKPVAMLVPEQVKRTVGISSNFLCDNLKYVFGIDNKNNARHGEEAFQAFAQLHHTLLAAVEDKGAQAVLRFYSERQANSIEPEIAEYLDALLKGGNIVFMLDGDTCFIHQRPAVKQAWERHYYSKEPGITAQCLISGEQGEIPNTHLPIKGVRGAQSSGGAIVSFNKESFKSYNKDQSFNAPVSRKAAVGYVTALNYLLADKRHKLQLGDATTVFWAEVRADLEENIFGAMLQPEITVDDVQTTALIKSIFESVRRGTQCDYTGLGLNSSVHLYTLGLSPNAARISVRFWYVDTFGRLMDNLMQHYRDMHIILPEKTNAPIHPGIWRILLETAVQGKSENIPPCLEGEITRSVLSGQPYPQSLYMAVITRIRADGNINSVRTGVVKACLIRRAKLNKNIDREVLTVSLNEQSNSTAYCLGRLFAVLEKAQKEAIPGIGATIRDRYYSSASATPASVFPQLIKLAQNHISKLDYGVKYDQLLEKIISRFQVFPKTLNLNEQGEFILGYYHQREDFYKKTNDNKDSQ